MNIIFDFDGTLIDISEKYFFTHTVAAKNYSIPIIAQKKYWEAKRRKTPEWEIINKDKTNNVFLQYEKTRIELLEHSDALAKDILFPWVIDLLTKVRRKNHQLYLLTARKNKKNFLEQIIQFHIQSLFTNISCNYENNSLQTKRNFLRTLLLSPNDLMIGDTEMEIFLAKENNIQSLAVTSGIRNKELLKSYIPDLLLPSVKAFHF